MKHTNVYNLVGGSLHSNTMKMASHEIGKLESNFEPVGKKYVWGFLGVSKHQEICSS